MKSQAAQAAALIRAELRRNGVAATVTSKVYSGGSSVNVRIADPLPATRQAVEEFASRFQAGHFDGMTDCYEYSNRRDDVPQVRFVFVDADYSDETRQAAWDWLRARFAGLEDAPERVERAYAYRAGHWDCYGSDLVHRALTGVIPGFWITRKPRVRAAA